VHLAGPAAAVFSLAPLRVWLCGSTALRLSCPDWIGLSPCASVYVSARTAYNKGERLQVCLHRGKQLWRRLRIMSSQLLVAVGV
jgi:hypothetical protein